MASPTPTSTPAASAATVQALVGEFLENRQRERREGALADAPQRMRKVLAVVALVTCAIVWTLPSLYHPIQSTPSAERQEASVRMTLFLASERVRAFQRQHDRLPQTLIEAGVDTTGMTYRLGAASTFDLAMGSRGGEVTFRSSMNGAEFLGSTIQVLTTAR